MSQTVLRASSSACIKQESTHVIRIAQSSVIPPDMMQKKKRNKVIQYDHEAF